MAKVVIVLTSAGLLLWMAALNASDLDVRREIQAIYNRASAAAVATKTYADAEALHRWLDTPDCVFADFGQRPKTWTEMRAEVVSGLQTQLRAFSNQIEKIEVQRDIATTTTVVRGTAVVTDLAGQFGPKGVVHEIVTTATVQDVWTRTSSGWRRRSHIKIIPNRISSVDGKPIP